ncbi:MAG: hypothetical protein OSB62_07315 [Alphaproteobacteria bacterium]|nr:hypothetical protein [Alphaproteobacteria bacterium]
MENSTDSKVYDREQALVDTAKSFAISKGLNENAVLDIYLKSTDWSFIIQLNALIDIAIEELITTFLRLEVDGKQKNLERFLSNLNFNGKTSAHTLLVEIGIHEDFIKFIGYLKDMRNTFAHSVEYIDSTILDYVLQHDNKKNILKNFSYIEDSGYIEEDFLDLCQREDGILKRVIFEQAIQFLRLVTSLSQTRGTR